MTQHGVTRRGMAGLGLLLAGCSPAGILNDLAPRRLVADGVAYGELPRQRLDVYAPERPRGPAPVLVFLYGGGWTDGERSLYRFLGAAFAAHGFVTMIPDYRLYPAVRFPDFLRDCALALAWARRHGPEYGGAAGPLWLMGHSAGAYNAAMLALDPAWLGAVGLQPATALRGCIGLAGPYDFLPLYSATLAAIFAPAGNLQLTQPIHFVDGRNPAMLLLAGLADTTVLPDNTQRLTARIRAAGGAVQERLYPRIDHIEIVGAIAEPVRFLAPTLRDCLAFMAA